MILDEVEKHLLSPHFSHQLWLSADEHANVGVTSTNVTN
jgi:hypothetical protein